MLDGTERKRRYRATEKGWRKEWEWNHSEAGRAAKRRWIKKHGKKYRKIANARRTEIRKECLEYYGGKPPKCACCQDTTEVFLTIDHKKGGGRKHRRSIGNGNLPVWLRRNKFPKDYRVLCFNCNYAVYKLGKCPHQK